MKTAKLVSIVCRNNNIINKENYIINILIGNSSDFVLLINSDNTIVKIFLFCLFIFNSHYLVTCVILI